MSNICCHCHVVECLSFSLWVVCLGTTHFVCSQHADASCDAIRLNEASRSKRVCWTSSGGAMLKSKQTAARQCTFSWKTNTRRQVTIIIIIPIRMDNIKVTLCSIMFFMLKKTGLGRTSSLSSAWPRRSNMMPYVDYIRFAVARTTLQCNIHLCCSIIHNFTCKVCARCGICGWTHNICR